MLGKCSDIEPHPQHIFLDFKVNKTISTLQSCFEEQTKPRQSYSCLYPS
jgi:hypothetical protein